MTEKPSSPSTGSCGRGRPRLLTLDAIVEAATRLGTDRLTMKGLAEELDVAVGTLYRYVDGRNGLLELIAARQLRGFQDEHQEWQDFPRAFAWSNYRVMSNNPTMLTLYLEGVLGPESQADLIDSFIRGMIRRGFATQEAERIQLHVQAVAFGLVAHATNLAARRAHCRRSRTLMVR
ncbi:TetR/AcrR family transcriptional regulator [Nocardia farcinica]|uniref:TetR/AcrR family transcriptional regulator n=1 Tax=Nocardia farcinica TaxID=37329 RepID=UPI002456F10C|nr:helix-turn-helix domain-containing protein [Nocardia farcinica]